MPLPTFTTIRLVLFACSLVTSAGLHAQVNEQRFVVDICPDGSPLTEEQLNARVRHARVQADVEREFRAVFARMELDKVLYHENLPDGRLQNLIFYIPSGRSASTGMRTLGTRDVYTGPLRNEAELQALFTDSLAVLGDLELLLGAAFAPSLAAGYYLYWTEPGGDAFRRVDLPVRNGALRIGRELFPGLDAERVEVVLRNDQVSDGALGHAVLHFIPAAVERHLRVVVCEALAGMPGSTLAQQRAECVRLVGEWYGRIHPANALRVQCMDR